MKKQTFACLLALSALLGGCDKKVEDPSYCRLSATPYFFQRGGATLMLPTAFTPNGDGKNDVYRPAGYTGISTYSMTIFDAYGTQMSQSTDPSEGWPFSYASAMQLTRYTVHLQFTTVNGDQVDTYECVSVLGYDTNSGCIQADGNNYYFEDQLDPSQPGSYYATGEVICP